MVEIVPRLWLGSAKDLRRAKAFDLVVIAAPEREVPWVDSYGILVMRYEMDDYELTSDEAEGAEGLASLVATALEHGHHVLVVCHMGLNRSAFIVSLILMNLGATGLEALNLVRSKRRGALTNKTFVAYLLGR